jgi:integrase
MALTDKSCKNAKASDKLQKKADGKGLYLLITPAGGKYWRMKYRYAGKEKTLALGVYPEVSLADARDDCDKARKELAADRDPMTVKRQNKVNIQTRSENTLEHVARRWHREEGKRLKWKDVHSGKVLRSLEQDVFPILGSRPITDISPADMLSLLDRVAARNAHETASRIKQRCNAIFNFGIKKLVATVNPLIPLEGSFQAPANKHYARVKIQELPELLRQLDDFQGHKQTALAIRMMAYTFIRTKELRFAKWTDIDVEQAIWTVPEQVGKGGLFYFVPLADQVLEIIEQLRTINGDSPYLFPGERSRTVPMSENTVLFAIYRLGYHGRMTGHGFRGIASTALNEMGFEPTIVERQLSHVERNKVRKAYNAAEYLDERTRMMQHWADYIDGLVAGSNVLPGRFGKAA